MASKEYGEMKIRHKKGALFLGTYITSFSFFLCLIHCRIGTVEHILKGILSIYSGRNTDVHF